MQIEEAYAVLKKHRLYEVVQEEFERNNGTNKGYTNYVPLWNSCIEHLGIKKNEIIKQMEQIIAANEKPCASSMTHNKCYHYDAILQKEHCIECSFYKEHLKSKVDDILEIGYAIKCFKERIAKDFP